MNTILFHHPACVEHDPGSHHPERPDRIRAVMAALEDEAFQLLDRREAPRATDAQLLRIHPQRHLDAIREAAPGHGHTHLDPDTAMSPGSLEAALRAAGAVCAAVDAVLGGEALRAFCAVRPPGHHAEPTRPMGFCLFNNVAVGAEQARAVHGLERVAVVDFDVHHGNGTQAAFWDREGLFYASTHQWPLYPGTGRTEETGAGGVVVNALLQTGTGSAPFREAIEGSVIPALDAFRPQLLMISAGFDGHAADPLAGLRLTDADFAWVTEALIAVADTHCGGRVVSTLEGGYDLASLARSTVRHVRALMEA